jgi:hypothetical protein
VELGPELDLLHAARRAMQSEQRLGRGYPGMDEELACVLGRIDELELAELGEHFWRRQLVFRLQMRLFDLLLADAHRLLEPGVLR